MRYSNKEKIVSEIWENPDKAFNCPFRLNGRYWENLRGGEYDEKGKIRLALTRNGENIRVFYNGSSREDNLDVFTHLERYVLFSSGFADTLKRLADIYGITLEYDEKQSRQMSRQAIAREVAAVLIESLRKNPTGIAGTYITKQRGLQLDGVHFGELTIESINNAKEHLSNRNIAYTDEDFRALQLTEYNVRKGYNVVIPYYHNGNAIGFILRNTTDTPDVPKYLYSQEMGRGGYCDRLKIGQPTFVVEGQMDAIRLIQAYATDTNAPNILAMGGGKISEDIATLLKRHNIDVVTYVPDVEYNEQGERKTTIIQDAIKAFQTIKVEDEHVIKTLFISEFETPEGVNLNGYKIDADTYGKQNGNGVLVGAVEGNAIDWYLWELKQLEQWANTADDWDGWNFNNNFRDRFREIYKRVDIWERQPIRNYIKDREPYKQCGVIPQVLEDEDAYNRDKKYKDQIKAVYSEFSKAIEDGANPVTIAKIAEHLNNAQATNSREEWDKQINMSFADELALLRNMPESLKSKWTLGIIKKKDKSFKEIGKIEFTPADLTVFCAPTSHGKTMILFQSALDLVREYTNKMFLYVSCEESDAQLLERALNAFIPIPTTENGKDDNKGYCFKERTRRKTIQAVLHGDLPPQDYEQYLGTSEHYSNLKKQIEYYISQYENNIFPRLKLIHTDASTESICNNITQFVTKAQENGHEVGAVFVDYMQLLGTQSKHFSRHDELKEVCKALSDCAKRNNVAIVIAAQFNRQVYGEGIDNISVANIGEGADIERIAKDIFLLWQVDKTPLNLYYKKGSEKEDEDDDIITNPTNLGKRSKRLFSENVDDFKEGGLKLKKGYIYIEQLKARYGETGGWGLLPFKGESGRIEENDISKMKE